MVKSEWIVIVNPKAGVGKGLKDWPLISGLLNRNNIDFTCAFTERKYHAIELTVKFIKKGFRNIVAVGGDGTIHEVVNGIFFQKEVPTTEINLAVIPTGSGNDWIRMFGISRTYSEAVKSLMEMRTTYQDVGKIDFIESKVEQTRYLANTSGLGFDAMVCYHSNTLKEDGKSGKWVYLRSGAKAFFGHRPKMYEIYSDGELFYRGKVFSVSIGIGKYCGGGMQQNPEAEVNDGFADLTVIKKISRMKILKSVKKLYSGDIYSISEVIHTQTGKVTITTDPIERIEIDGEVVGTSPFRFELIPKAINVVVGANYSERER